MFFHIFNPLFQATMKVRIFLFLYFIFSIQAIAQNGNYSLSHFNPLQERSDYLSFDLTQDDRGIIYIAGKEGVEEFDGRSWRLIPTPGVTYTLAKTTNGIVVGGFEQESHAPHIFFYWFFFWERKFNYKKY